MFFAIGDRFPEYRQSDQGCGCRKGGNRDTVLTTPDFPVKSDRLWNQKQYPRTLVRLLPTTKFSVVFDVDALN
jgi:hypothetical protein